MFHGIFDRIKRPVCALAVATGMLAITASTVALSEDGMLAAYRQAEAFLPRNAQARAHPMDVVPHWIDGSDRFWYRRAAPEGTTFVMVDPARKQQEPAFDHTAIATALQNLTGETQSATALPFDQFEFAGQGRAINLVLDQHHVTCSLQGTVACQRLAAVDQPVTHESLSPDGRRAAYTEGGNLFVRSTASGKITQLTDDAEPFYDYASLSETSQSVATLRRAGVRYPPVAIWSPDSRRLLTHRLDQRQVGEMLLVQGAPPGSIRPKVFPYRMSLAGDEHIAMAQMWVFDVESGKGIKLDAEPLIVPYVSPISLKLVWWDESGDKAYFIRETRDFRNLTLTEADAATGKTREMVQEVSATYAELYLDFYRPDPNVRILGGGKEVLWFSERDGWGHLYRMDAATGQVLNPVTRGEWVVNGIKRVDEKARQVWLTAGGREPDRNPYYRHLYRVGLDGQGLQLLTPEDADHEVSLSPSGKYFVDVVGRVDAVPVSIVRDAKGKLVMELERGDVSALLAEGWQWPEVFRAKARDGVTDVWGVMYRPTTFDAARRYPVLDDIYPGPQTIRSAIRFPGSTGTTSANAGWYWGPQSTAELGFVVVTIEGMGTPLRSKAFHDFGYQNLGDGGGLPDHIAAMQQLATRYPFLNLDKVGIYGGSSGGYATIQAMLMHGDFYDVGVSAVPYIGPSHILPWWGERFQGYPLNESYARDDSPGNADGLKGKLMIALGELDENANPLLVMPLLDALIAANKNFDLLYMPNRTHGGVGSDPYFQRRRWDYFVEHLLGKEPVADYLIGAGK